MAARPPATRTRPLVPLVPKKRKRGAVCFLLFAITAPSASRVGAEAGSVAEALGAGFMPLVFLVLATVFAWKDRARLLRAVCSLVILTSVAAFAVGLRNALDRRAGMDEMTRELGQLSTSLADDLAGGDVGPEATERRAAEMDAALQRLRASGNDTAVVFAEVVGAIWSTAEESGQRLDAAVTDVALPRFLDVHALAAERDFEWQRAVATEYEQAALASLEDIDALPELARTKLASRGMGEDFATGVMGAIQRKSAALRRVLEAHVATARSYSALVEFFAEHHGAVSFHGTEGEWDIHDAELAKLHDELCEASRLAEERLQAAFDAHLRALSAS